MDESFRADTSDDVKVAGLNLHFDVTDTSYMYGGFYRKINDSKMVISGFSPGGKALVAENNTEAWDMGADLVFGGLQLEGERVFETGDAGTLGNTSRSREAFPPVELSAFEPDNNF